MKVVIDTNVLLVSISKKSSWHWLFTAIADKRLEVYVTTEILHEYEEKITEHWSAEVAKAVVRFLTELSSVHLISTYYRLRLISVDEDDNKFVDCAFAANADYIISNDKHFNILKEIDFPRIEPIRLEDFQPVLEKFL